MWSTSGTSRQLEKLSGRQSIRSTTRRGDQPSKSNRSFHYSTVADLSVVASEQVGANISGNVLQVVQAEISGYVQSKSNQKVGEKFVRSIKLRMKAQPGDRVLYRVTWIQTVRIGECIVGIGMKQRAIPYRFVCGLDCEVRVIDHH